MSLNLTTINSRKINENSFDNILFCIERKFIQGYYGRTFYFKCANVLSYPWIHFRDLRGCDLLYQNIW